VRWRDACCRAEGLARLLPGDASAATHTDLIDRLRERKLVQWILAYLAAAWLVLQLADILGERFAWPEAALRTLTVLLGVGFFAALVIGWFHGEKGEQRVRGVARTR